MGQDMIKHSVFSRSVLAVTGLLLAQAYNHDKGEHRHEIIVPDTAHGTNPASVTMAGYELVQVATDTRGLPLPR